MWFINPKISTPEWEIMLCEVMLMKASGFIIVNHHVYFNQTDKILKGKSGKHSDMVSIGTMQSRCHLLAKSSYLL